MIEALFSRSILQIDKLTIGGLKELNSTRLQCRCVLPFLSILFPAVKDLANAETSFQTDAHGSSDWQTIRRPSI